MGKNLFDFGDEIFEKEKNKSEYESKNKFKKTSEEELKSSQNTFKNSSIQDEAKKIYDKYSTFSQQDLIKEFVDTSRQKLLDGSLSKEKINQTASLLSPYLNSQQKEMLKNLMDKIDV